MILMPSYPGRTRLSLFGLFVIVLALLFLLAAPVHGQSNAEPAQRAGGDNQPYISEVAPASGAGNPAWVELAIEHERAQAQHTLYLPLIWRAAPSGAEAAAPDAASGPTTVELSGWQVSDEDGNQYTIPDALPPVPLSGILVILFDGQGAGADDYDFGDGVATLHTPAALVNIFDPGGDQVALYNSANHTAETIVDFVAWGQVPGTDQTNAVAASIWPTDAFQYFDGGFGSGVAAIPPSPNDSIAVWQNVDADGPTEWGSYYAPNSSRGRLNPPPTPIHSTIADGAILGGETLGMAWTTIPGAIRYEFQLDDAEDFAAPLVSVTLDEPAWSPDAPLADGTYYWRVRAIAEDGTRSGYLGPLEVTSVLMGSNGLHAPSGGQVTLLDDDEYKFQRKDTILLDIGGGPNNTPGMAFGGSQRFNTLHRWDGPHVDGNGDPTFSWNGLDNWNCVRASTAMMNDYYGGNLSEDRISYHMFEDWSGTGATQLGVPENDLGFSSGIGSYAGHIESVSWALGTPIAGISYCPNPGTDGYTCPDTNAAPIDFATVQGWIDAGQPFQSTNLNNAHMRVVDGYWMNGDTPFVRVLDPVDDGDGDGRRWEAFATFQDDHERAYVGPANAPNVRSDEASVSADSDGDGVSDFDENLRFFTDPYDADTDDDWLDDKTDIAEYIFDSSGTYNPRASDFDNDGIRKELDWDNDGDSVPDGCEDANQDGVFQAATESSNFNANDSQVCQPRFDIINPRSGQASNAGDPTNPDKVLVRLNMSLPPSLPNAPVYAANQFTVTIGGDNAPVISGAKVGQEFWLLVQAPAKDSNAFYELAVTFDGTESDSEPNAVYYIPRPRMNTMVVFDTSGSMSELGKLEAAKNAARLYVDQWGINDRIGLVTFDDVAAVAEPLEPIVGSGQKLTDTKNIVNSLTADGQTAMGPGLLLGQQQLEADGDDEHDWSMMMLTDGQENVEPYWAHPSVSTPIINSKTVVHTVALGPANAAYFSLLQQIAGATNGTFAPVYEPEGNLLAAPTGGATFAAELPNQLADAYKYAAEQILFEERIFEASAVILQNERDTYRFYVGQWPSVLFTVNYDLPTGVRLEIRDPQGTLISPTGTGVQFRGDTTHKQYRVFNPASGIWRMDIVGGPPGTVVIPTEYLALASADAPLTMDFVVGALDDGTAPLIVLLADQAPVLDAQVVVDVLRPNGQPGAPITLLDDGAHGDGAADDGIYGGSITPTIPGTYLLKARAQGNDNEGHPFYRHAQGSLTYERRIAYVHTDGADPQPYLDLRTLLAEVNLPLEAVPMSEVAAINWPREYELIIVASDTGQDRIWGTEAQQNALFNSRTPIIGMGQGGHALFGQWGLEIGYPHGRANTEHRTQPVTAAAPYWMTPYPLVGRPPYALYNATAGLGIPGTAAGGPPPGTQPIGREPSATPPHYNIIAEDNRFLLWGFQAPAGGMTENGRSLFANVVIAVRE